MDCGPDLGFIVVWRLRKGERLIYNDKIVNGKEALMSSFFYSVADLEHWVNRPAEWWAYGIKKRHCKEDIKEKFNNNLKQIRENRKNGNDQG